MTLITEDNNGDTIHAIHSAQQRRANAGENTVINSMRASNRNKIEHASAPLRPRDKNWNK